VNPETGDSPPGLAALREPFPASQVGQLPKGGVLLDYVGHGAVTARLLDVDPEWNWEPLAVTDTGLPLFTCDANGNPIALWIRLTVLGVTRLGVGTCRANQFDAEKVLIGDALRNAAMRFGVALDLWTRGHAEDDEKAPDSGDAPDRDDPRVPGLRSSIEGAIARLTDAQKADLRAWFAERDLPPVRVMTAAQADQVLAHLIDLPDEGDPT
jgi:hypothetical protein